LTNFAVRHGNVTMDLGRFPNVPFSKRQIFKLFVESELFGDVFRFFWGPFQIQKNLHESL